MKAVKILSGVVFLIAVAVVAVIVYFLNNINMIVKEAVETVGPDVTETRVSLDRVDIRLREGRGELNDFVIGNPAGFNHPHLFRFDKVVLHVDPGSLGQEVIVLKELTFDGINISAEQKGLNTNIQALLKTLDDGASSSAESSSSSTDSSVSGESDVKFMVEKLRFTGGAIDLITEKLGSYQVDLPEINQRNIGDKQSGLTPSELGQAVLKPLLSQAKKSVEKKLKSASLDKLEAKAKEKLEEVKQGVESEIKKKQEALDEKKHALEQKKEQEIQKKKEALKNKEKALKDDAEKKLKGLFGG